LIFTPLGNILAGNETDAGLVLEVAAAARQGPRERAKAIRT
jgi:hypothetical protein